MNKFKISALRQFGSENVSFTAEIESENQTLSPEEMKAQVTQIDTMIKEAFVQVNEREIAEKEVLANFSEKRRAAVAKLDEALKEEMRTKALAEGTRDEAIRLDERLKKIADKNKK